MAKVIQFPIERTQTLHQTMCQHMVSEILDEVTQQFIERGIDIKLLDGLADQLIDAVERGVPENVTFQEFEHMKATMSGRWLKILNIDLTGLLS